jgi:hypothetical protein
MLLEPEKSKTKVLVDLVSGEGLPPGLLCRQPSCCILENSDVFLFLQGH